VGQTEGCAYNVVLSATFPGDSVSYDMAVEPERRIGLVLNSQGFGRCLVVCA